MTHYISENIDLEKKISVNEIIFSYLSHGNAFTHCISELDSYLYLWGRGESAAIVQQMGYTLDRLPACRK